MTLASGGSPMFPLVDHQPASPSIWPAVQSLWRGLSTNPGVTMWCVCGSYDYRFIVRFPIALDFVFITFLCHFFLSWTYSLSISSSAASTLSNHVLLGLPTGLLPSTLNSIHFFTQSSSHVHTISVYDF